MGYELTVFSRQERQKMHCHCCQTNRACSGQHLWNATIPQNQDSTEVKAQLQLNTPITPKGCLRDLRSSPAKTFVYKMHPSGRCLKLIVLCIRWPWQIIHAFRKNTGARQFMLQNYHAMVAFTLFACVRSIRHPKVRIAVLHDYARAGRIRCNMQGSVT